MRGRRGSLEFTVIRLHSISGRHLKQERRVLASPQCPLLHIIRVVLHDIVLDGRGGSELNRLLYILCTAGPRSTMHGQDHLVASGVIINLRHPSPHNVHSAENDGAFHLASFQISKHLVNGIGSDRVECIGGSSWAQIFELS